MKKLILALLSSYVCFAYHSIQAAFESETVVVGDKDGFGFISDDEDGFSFSDDDTAPTPAPLNEAVPSAQQAFEAPYVISLGSRKFKCSACDYAINKQNHCQKHIDRNHPKTREEGMCSDCSTFFLFKKELDMHKKGHRPDLYPNACTIVVGCIARFQKPSDLRNHINSHNGVKGFVCNICYKSFGKNSTLTSHMRLHTGERPFKCCQNGCLKEFSTATLVRQHLESHGYSKDQARGVPLEKLKEKLKE